MVETFRLLEKHSMKLASQNYFGGSESHASPYRAVLINRFDVAFTDKLGPADRADLDKTSSIPRTRRTTRCGPRSGPSFVMNMIASIPGWLLGCYFSHATPLAGCLRWPLAGHRAARRVVDRQGRKLLAPSSPGGRAEAEQ